MTKGRRQANSPLDHAARAKASAHGWLWSPGRRTDYLLATTRALASTRSQVLGMELLHNNLHEVFSQRDPERRWAAIERTYTEDVTFIDPEGAFVGRQALSDQAQKLLDGVLAGFVLEEDGPRYIGTDIAALAWRFGPPGHPVARGIDILTIRDGRVSAVRTLIAP